MVIRVVIAGLVLMVSSVARAQMHPVRDYWVGNEPEPAYIPAAANPTRFPLHVRIEDMQERYDGMSFSGVGDARLLNEGGQTRIYSFRCGQTFLPNTDSGDFYSARWTRQGQKIQLIMLQKPGSNQTRRCTLRLH